MTVTNKYFLGAEIALGSWTISHTVINDWLQTGVLLLGLIAGSIGVYRTLFPNKKRK